MTSANVSEWSKLGLVTQRLPQRAKSWKVREKQVLLVRMNCPGFLLPEFKFWSRGEFVKSEPWLSLTSITERSNRALMIKALLTLQIPVLPCHSLHILGFDKDLALLPWIAKMRINF